MWVLLATGALKRAAITLAVIVCTVAGQSAKGGIVGSVHDFSAQGWSQGEVCLPCHTPHNAQTPQLVPLWNHQPTVATFTLYTSSTMTSIPGQPGAHSKSCLSCHDGTVAVDSFGGASGSEYVSGTALIGTDLSNDHPIGMTFSHEPGLNCQTCHQTHPWGFVSVLPFYDGKVECATCHDPHNQKAVDVKLLRKPRAGSAICLHCHAK